MSLDSEAGAATAIIYPCLRYNDGNAAIAWLEEAFGFERVAVHPGPDGAVAHAELRLGTGIVMLGSMENPEIGLTSPRNLGGGTQCIYVHVADVDAHFARAEAAGATVVYAPRDTDYGSREYGVRDPEGHFWSFGTYRPQAAG